MIHRSKARHVTTDCAHVTTDCAHVTTDCGHVIGRHSLELREEEVDVGNGLQLLNELHHMLQEHLP